jgi:23S rRNA pseudouridine1911/1915/1917 synthase
VFQDLSATINHLHLRAGVRAGVRPDRHLRLHATRTSRAASGNAEVEVLLEDEDLWVVDKPEGLVTESVSGERSLATLLAMRSTSGRVWIVQRLDRATSGVMVVAKNEASNRALARAASDHLFERSYLAVVRGAFPEDLSLLDAPLRGRQARTRVSVVERFGELASRLGCTLETGRTHQIRQHCARAGHPVLGDPRHGQRTAWDPPRMALHASRLGFDHPRSGRRLVFEVPPPPELAQWLVDLRTVVNETSELGSSRG